MGETGAPGAPRTVLRGAMLADGTGADVAIADGSIEAVGAVTGRPGDDVVDLAGQVLLTAAVEPHAHLDKAFLAELLPNATGDLMGAIEAMVGGRPRLGVDETIVRAERAARLLAA